jgi:hypothetical protein
MMERGMRWAAEGKAYVETHNVDPEKYDNSAKMY